MQLKESWVLPPVEFSHGEVEQAFQNAAHQLSGAIELGGQEHFILKGKFPMRFHKKIRV